MHCDSLSRKRADAICVRSSPGSSTTSSRNKYLGHREQPTFPLLVSSNRSSAHLISETEGTVSRPPDLVQGTLDLLLLKILALEPLHGWAIGQRLKQVSEEDLQVSDGSLYPALHKLELAGWITAEWKVTELGRRAKFYSLTRAGRRRLDQETEEWRRLSSAISRVLSLREV
jgi:PadR family transcriptional regulator, regulatory protein PadR